MLSLRFLQLSDLWLGKAASLGFRLSGEQQSQLEQDKLRALERARDIALQHEVDVVLVPGNLWDDDTVPMEAALEAYELLGSMAPVPVLLLPGSGDPLHPLSLHNASYYESKAQAPFPRNVRVVTETGRGVTLPLLPDVDFCGTDSLGGATRQRSGVLNIALHCLDQSASGEPNIADVASGRADFVAVGGSGAYAESISGQSAAVACGPLAEPAAQGFAVIGEINKADRLELNLHKLDLGQRKVVHLAPEFVSPPDGQQVREVLDRLLAEHNVTPHDLVVLQPKGEVSARVIFDALDPQWIAAHCFHLELDASQLSGTEELVATEVRDETSRRRVEGRFEQRMRELIAEEQDPQQRRVLTQALTFGVNALQGKEVVSRDVA